MCFTCGPANTRGIGMQWYLKDDGVIFGEVALTEHQQGPPGNAHGGASAALLDEAMGAAAWAAGHKVAAVNLNVDFQQPVPLGEKISITGRVVGKEGKVVRTEGEIRLPDGEVAVAGRGIYVEAEHLFSKVKFRHMD
jgi:uncharacterized protein (TIGR00369 family)